MKKQLVKFTIVPIFLLSSLPSFSAKPINLSHQTTSLLASFLTKSPATQIEEVSRATDFKNTLHFRIKQTYLGYPVWNGDAVVHIPQEGNTKKNLMNAITPASSMNGTFYQDLNLDLRNTPAFIFDSLQAQKALQQAINVFQQKKGAKPEITHPKTRMMVYVDQQQKAHWVFWIQFDAEPVKAREIPERPTYIVDAISFKIYKQWNDIKTLDDVDGGGFGGNTKMGKMVYDGLSGHLPKLHIQRNADTNTCYLQNADVTVLDSRKKSEVMTFACKDVDHNHNGVYWNADHDAIHGAYSPSNDALHEGAVIKEMYQKWYKQNVLEEDGKPMMLNMVVHEPMENAYWDGKQMVFGDGDGILLFYPLTSLDVAAHEISHGFTEQHANLTYEGQSGGMNESFSDMASQAAYYYTSGKNNWKIGADITLWLLGDAIRYMDIPSKDCHGTEPGDQCSIDDASQYKEGVDVHFSSGVYNRFFYLLAKSSGWNTKKAFDVMVQANMYYWTPNTTFIEGACGVLSAAKDLDYDIKAITKAAGNVGIETSDC